MTSALNSLTTSWKNVKRIVSNAPHYLIGNWRYKLYYSIDWGWLMRKHIREQIDYRIDVMDKECYAAGACKMCGCATTALQMANKACDKPCYPPMFGKKSWIIMKKMHKL